MLELPSPESRVPTRIPAMGLIVPNAIEGYLATLNRGSDDVLDRIARDNESRGLPLVDAEVGALLRVLATAIGARRILEIGTAVGYSGIWLAGALPPAGMLITMEVDPERAKTARANFDRAGLHMWRGAHPRGNRWAFPDWDFPGLKTAVKIDGTLNDSGNSRSSAARTLVRSAPSAIRTASCCGDGCDPSPRMSVLAHAPEITPPSPGSRP